ncbi:hypothetical protein FOA52_009932 [Chlamydomonas sp. UWO 241]|nr:hypothetical protein FOA52_009932 [Chlamydomonas sp. UWO 241]
MQSPRAAAQQATQQAQQQQQGQQQQAQAGGAGAPQQQEHATQHRSKRMKKAHGGDVVALPAALPHYAFSPNNVLARVQSAAASSSQLLLFNTEHTFALLDHRPASRGHCLLVVKHPVATLLDELPPGAMAAVMADLQVLSRAVQEATSCPGLKLLQNSGPAAGQTVPQLHFHLVPVYEGQGDPMQAPANDRPQLDESDAGLLTAALRNALPAALAPGLSVWASSSDEMEAVGTSLQQHGLGRPGTVLLLSGHLGAGKSTVSRGFVRAACRDPLLDVPSPTFLLCLSYKEDIGHDPAARAAAAEAAANGLASAEGGVTVHHMDPYRLGNKADKIAGLIDFGSAFEKDVCLIEWPDRMPTGVMALPMAGVRVSVSGTGTQAAGRLVTLTALSVDDPASTLVNTWRAAGGLPAPDVRWRIGGADSAPVGPDAASGTAGGTVGGTVKAVPADRSEWLVLGIESSCDDTAAAVVAGDGRILGHCIASQAGLHEQYGGVKPDVARDAHAAAIQATVDTCLAEAGIEAGQLTAVAATVGPGLSLCLQVGVQHGLAIAARHRLPFVPVHHMEAHALITRLPGLLQTPTTFPALVLLASGGHNMIVFSEGVGRHRIIGTTLDDSAGECFDKIARLVGISSIPGGPHLEALATAGEAAAVAAGEAAARAVITAGGDAGSAAVAGARAAAALISPFEVTMPMQTGAHRESCNFSFSGIKTSVAKLIEGERTRLGLSATLYTGPGSASARAALLTGTEAAEGAGSSAQVEGVKGVDGVEGVEGVDPHVATQLHASTCLIAAAFTRVTVRFMQQRTRRALSWLADDARQAGAPAVTCLVVAGGVAANKSVRAGLETVASEFGVPCVCPPVKHCTDNGLMVAWTGVERLALGLSKAPPPDDPEAIRANVDVLPRWPIGPVDPRSSAGLKYSKMFH